MRRSGSWRATRHNTSSVTWILACFVLSLVVSPAARAADHGEAPLVSQDRSCDIGDIYLFVDPNDSKNVVIAMSVQGFIVPGENANFGFFDPSVRYRFLIDNTSRARGDLEIFVQFSAQTSKAEPQIATITLPDGTQFNAPTTISSATAPEQPRRMVTFDPASQVYFFAGITDDPFFFDIPALGRFIASVFAGSPNPAVLSRGRDSFAGYNTGMIVLEVPVSMIRGSASNNIVGLSGYSQRRERQFYPERFTTKGIRGEGDWVTVDRAGNPAVQVVLIPPLAQKDLYNQATLRDDTRGAFASIIVDTLRRLGTDQTSIDALAGVAITNGDQLRLDLSIPNTGTGGGDNPAAGFPNGRRPKDDVVDTLLFFIANRTTLGDSVPTNDVPFRNKFPFFGYAQPPRVAGTTDDNTRN